MDVNLVDTIAPAFVEISKALMAAVPSLVKSVAPVFAMFFAVNWLRNLFVELAGGSSHGLRKTDADYYDPRNAHARRDEGVFDAGEYDSDSDSGEYTGHDPDEDESEGWYSL